MKTRAALLALILACASGQADPSPPRVITHPGVQQERVSLNQLRAIFGMRHRKWDDRSLIHVFVLDNGDDLHTRFCTDTLRVLPHQLKRAWGRLVFSGTGQAPTRVSSGREMLQRVAATPGAIGYISGDAGLQGVRTLPLK